MRLFQRRRPDVTILDLALPGMNGVTVLHKLRKMDDTAPVIALTGAADPAIENEVRKLGVADFLRKGLDLEIILRSVGQTINESVHTAAASATQAPDSPARILVADDDPDIRQLLHEFLTREGYRVSTAAHGEEALGLVEQTRPHLVLLDLVMQGMSGLAVLRRLSKQAPEVGVIVISGVQDHAIIQETMKLGSFDYVSKPVDLEALGISVRAKLFLMEARRRPWSSRWLGLKATGDSDSLIPEHPPGEPPSKRREGSNVIPFPISTVVGAELGEESAEAEIATLPEGTIRDRGRLLLTILFTDIVGATERATQLRDRRWRALLERHHALVRREIARFQGREIDTAGDGFLATFDAPARAIQCACAVSDVVRQLGIEIRAGLHTGECEAIGDKVGGIAVHIGARVAAKAGPGEVLVSSTVKDLVAGSDIPFEDRGIHALKGIPGEWRLFAVGLRSSQPRGLLGNPT